MITIICTNCQATLSIDDAFAGGVCRCQHCGTIQTVPGPQKTGRPASPAPAKPVKPGSAPKALVPGAARTTATGLDELADAVASSGLAGSGLASSRHTRAPAAAPAQPQPAAESRRKLLPIILIVAAAVIVLVGIVIAILLAHNNKPATGTAQTGTNIAAESPTFCGIPLPSGGVIFLLDRGNSAGDLFDTLKATAYKSISQLGTDRQFQIILWDAIPADTGTVEFPRGAMHNATSGEIENLKRDFQDVSSTGSTSLAGPLKEALDRHPNQIVIATGKWDLDDSDVAALRDAQGKGIRIDAVQLGSGSPNAALQEAARRTGGEFKTVTGAELREFSR